jgi:gluconokinase
MAKLVIMGVSGAGKTTLGSALAACLGWRFLDADDFHSPEAKAKIASGVTLDETDRAAWLARIKPAFDAVGVSTVLACSALKAIHRTSLAPDYLVHLVIGTDLAHRRLSARQGHFAGPSILASQFSTLETPGDALAVDAAQPTAAQVEQIIQAFALKSA